MFCYTDSHVFKIELWKNGETLVRNGQIYSLFQEQDENHHPVKTVKSEVVRFFKPEVLKKATTSQTNKWNDWREIKYDRHCCKCCCKVRPKQSLRVKPKEAGISKDSVNVNRMLKRQKIRHFKSKLVHKHVISQVIINKIKTGLSTTLPNILILVLE